MKKVILIFQTLILLNFNLVLCHTPSRDIGITLGNDFFYNSKNIGISPELSITAIILNASTSIQIQDYKKPVYCLFLGIGLFNILQVQYGFSNQNKIRFRIELPLLSDFPLWKKEPKIWTDRLNFKFQYEINFDDTEMNHIGLGVSYLLL